MRTISTSAESGSTSRAARFCGASALTLLWSDSCAGLSEPSASDGNAFIELRRWEVRKRSERATLASIELLQLRRGAGRRRVHVG